MGAERHVRIFKNGRSRAVRIPKELDIFGDEVVMREEAGRIVMELPKRRELRDVIDWLRAQPPLGPDEQFPDIDDTPPEAVEFP
jgi:antitoxin VapB